MDCNCGDPSCGYCQAASNQHTFIFQENEHEPNFFNGYVPPLQTIYEEHEEEYDMVDMGDLEDPGQPVNHISDRFKELQTSEDQKKRLRNTEAARRCREKVKNRTDELEKELSDITNNNEAMNQQRIRLLTMVEEQMRMLDLIKKRNPQLADLITEEARRIVDKYTYEINAKRDAIKNFFDNSIRRHY